MADEPGGGYRVTFKDPVVGVPLHLVYEQAPVTAQGGVPSCDRAFNFVRRRRRRCCLTIVSPVQKHREGNKFQRFTGGPAPVHKLGHFGMCVTDFAAAYRFYTTRFNFASSDVVYDDTDTSGDMTTFLHLGRGDELVDHHCFFFEGPVRHVHHASYETYDVDTQPLGHDGLCSKGYEDCRGVRRHLMGSQIFDHWFDPSRFVLEHYVDGDLVNRQGTTRLL
ncbi:hypothetical protein HMPREF1624_04651 [Sporothrix schenckii ATCC 58251]|uniref:VOC domain-containing protein n=1 Tax=Sporothrix schenckii (strain ATCC 58251 / de Perez 2211183) TaxID=1391915 RepID=U7PX10_SPOS1|nr:hypothetical protein HMPREF1624_04651 [Sporothrix schenckii ATCC 58251]